ncbi:hypothetical protein N9N03_02780, partial [Chlamydiia bacterium]|nr:hypothetical protein [Chlamydiia bacterium]
VGVLDMARRILFILSLNVSKNQVIYCFYIPYYTIFLVLAMDKRSIKIKVNIDFYSIDKTYQNR